MPHAFEILELMIAHYDVHGKFMGLDQMIAELGTFQSR